jgi:hypothetical protein
MAARKKTRVLPKARDAGDRKLLNDVKKVGWHVVIVGNATEPSWAFTVGLYETFQQPEIVIFGLRHETMHALLNNVGRLVQRGMKPKELLRSDRVIKNLPCEFRAVVKRWYEPLLGYANWFYGGESYPVLQCTWPDRKGRLPSSTSFDKALRRLQPSLWEEDARRARISAILRGS